MRGGKQTEGVALSWPLIAIKQANSDSPKDCRGPFLTTHKCDDAVRRQGRIT